ncbi:MAG TPA: hypothetical protein VM261_01795 [Kofleriaceae bacterium]|nr:hypothetical protein [Kofleriaceae bacterium]
MLLFLTAPAFAGGRQGPPSAGRTTKIAGRNCPEAGRAVVSVPQGFDGVRVVVADTIPGASVEVTVMAGSADRRVRAWGGGAWSLHMEAAPSGPVLVAVEPSLDAAIGACVERVELLRDEQVVADVRLR